MKLDGDAIAYVHHLRFFPGVQNPMTRGEALQVGILAKPEPKGGITLVQVEYGDGRTFRASARCSKRDNFNRAIGRQIALGRALKIAEEVG